MNGLTGKAALDTQSLRERNISLQTNGDDEARKAVLHLNALEENGEKQEKDKKTYGRTPDGIGKGSGFAQKRGRRSLANRYAHMTFVRES